MTQTPQFLILIYPERKYEVWTSECPRMSKNPKKIFLVEKVVYPLYREGGSIFPKKRGFK
jgi:hypothetical protein